jgi:DNA damage-binding protein 1
MKSVSVLEYKRGEAGLPDKLEEIARHFQTSWATAVAEVDENTYLESDAEGNLLVLHRDTNGVTESDRMRLVVTSDMLLGELVNRIRRITVPTSAQGLVIPRAFLATVSGHQLASLW